MYQVLFAQFSNKKGSSSLPRCDAVFQTCFNHQPVKWDTWQQGTKWCSPLSFANCPSQSNVEAASNVLKGLTKTRGDSDPNEDESLRFINKIIKCSSTCMHTYIHTRTQQLVTRRTSASVPVKQCTTAGGSRPSNSSRIAHKSSWACNNK